MLRLPKCDYLAPHDLKEALTMLTKEKRKAKVLAGGTDLLVKMKTREIRVQNLIGLKNIPGLNLIIDDGEWIKLGPLVTHYMSGNSNLMIRYADFLAEACRDLGSYQVRCMGTIAGNICNGSPSADTVPPLLALGAQLRILGQAGEKILPIDQFFIEPFKTCLGEDEILISIEVRKPSPSSRGVYLKVPKITENDETLVGVAVWLLWDTQKEVIEDIRIGLGSVAPIPMRATKTERYLRGKNPEDPKSLESAKKLLVNEISPRS